MTQIPFAEGLFTWPSDEPRLIGTRCPKCGITTFPVQAFCPGCPSDTMEEVLLEPRGTLWTFTTQDFRPKEPYRGPEERSYRSGVRRMRLQVPRVVAAPGGLGLS